jgi:hypothetical protein
MVQELAEQFGLGVTTVQTALQTRSPPSRALQQIFRQAAEAGIEGCSCLGDNKSPDNLDPGGATPPPEGIDKRTARAIALSKVVDDAKRD